MCQHVYRNVVMTLSFTSLGFINTFFERALLGFYIIGVRLAEMVTDVIFYNSFFWKNWTVIHETFMVVVLIHHCMEKFTNVATEENHIT